MISTIVFIIIIPISQMKNAKIPRVIFMWVLDKFETRGSFNTNSSRFHQERFSFSNVASNPDLKTSLFVSTVYEKFGINFATAKIFFVQGLRLSCSL